jgi:hypothetical protein
MLLGTIHPATSRQRRARVGGRGPPMAIRAPAVARLEPLEAIGQQP